MLVHIVNAGATAAQTVHGTIPAFSGKSLMIGSLAHIRNFDRYRSFIVLSSSMAVLSVGSSVDAALAKHLLAVLPTYASAATAMARINILIRVFHEEQKCKKAAHGTVVDEPVTEDPAADESVTEESAIEEFMLEVPVIEAPAVGEIVVEEPVAEEAMIDEPAVEEPVEKVPMIDEPVEEEKAELPKKRTRIRKPTRR